MIRKIAAVAAIAMVVALGVGSQAALAAPAQAHPATAPGPSASKAQAMVAQQVRNLLKYNPGAVQITPDSVRYKAQSSKSASRDNVDRTGQTQPAESAPTTICACSGT